MHNRTLWQKRNDLMLMVILDSDEDFAVYFTILLPSGHYNTNEKNDNELRNDDDDIAFRLQKRPKTK